MDILATKQDDWDVFKITHTFSPYVLGELSLITFVHLHSMFLRAELRGEVSIWLKLPSLFSFSCIPFNTMLCLKRRKVSGPMWFCEAVSKWSSEKNGRCRGSGIQISLRNVTTLLSCVVYLNNQGAPWAPWSNSGRNWRETVRFFWKH